MALSLMSRTLAKLREMGYDPWKVEVWNQWSKHRVDAWGFCDVIALGDADTLFLNSCDTTHLAEHKKKIGENASALRCARLPTRLVEIFAWDSDRRDEAGPCKECGGSGKGADRVVPVGEDTYKWQCPKCRVCRGRGKAPRPKTKRAVCLRHRLGPDGIWRTQIE